MKLMLFGAQGVGKGTIGAMLIEHFKIPLLGTGDMLREAVKEGTEFGKEAQECMNRGDLVSADLITNIVKEKLKQVEEGYILDGFPRNLEQAELFGEGMNEIDYIIEFQAPEELLLKRLSNRRICKDCGAVYNIHPECDPNPKEEGKCDKCGGELFQREDDNEEAIKKRLNIYHTETEPILDKFKDKVVQVRADDDPDSIFKRTLEVLSE